MTASTRRELRFSRYIHFYNGHRPHSTLDGRTPDQAYFSLLPFRAAA
jgi:putative transposase